MKLSHRRVAGFRETCQLAERMRLIKLMFNEVEFNWS